MVETDEAVGSDWDAFLLGAVPEEEGRCFGYLGLAAALRVVVRLGVGFGMVGRLGESRHREMGLELGGEWDGRRGRLRNQWLDWTLAASQELTAGDV